MHRCEINNIGAFFKKRVYSYFRFYVHISFHSVQRNFNPTSTIVDFQLRKPDFRQIRLDDSVTKVIQNISSQKEVLSEIFEQCAYEKPENSLQIKIGPFGSGAAVVTDTTIIDQVTEHSRKFLGFDMEAYGVMLAGYISNSPKTTPIVMKSVSDFGDGKDDRYQKYASYTSAQVLKLLITHLPY